MFNVINSCRNVINTKSSIKEDVRSINQILREDPLYHTDNTKRRQIIALKVAIANKQTVQVGARAINERAVDMVHRKILADYMPSIN